MVVDTGVGRPTPLRICSRLGFLDIMTEKKRKKFFSVTPRYVARGCKQEHGRRIEAGTVRYQGAEMFKDKAFFGWPGSDWAEELRQLVRDECVKN